MDTIGGKTGHACLQPISEGRPKWAFYRYKAITPLTWIASLREFPTLHQLRISHQLQRNRGGHLVMKLATAIAPPSFPTPPPPLADPMAPKHHLQAQTPPPSPPSVQNAPPPWPSHPYSSLALQRHTPPPPDTHHDSYFRRSPSL
jgi:hypothetical protein